jgi:hypothetical protein
MKSAAYKDPKIDKSGLAPSGLTVLPFLDFAAE